jgi:asparagine synthase (glutamine-hydrolysing)
MCGLVGLLECGGHGDRAALLSSAASMANRLAHRGPDDSDVWCDAQAGIALGHRRLAVVDLTPAGHQPMRSHDERFVIAYNGELYNTADVRAEIEGARGQVQWRGHSDTEVLLEAISIWGVKDALRRVVGMFAFALWDRAQRRLTLARDRVGEKPLYYGRFGDTLLFGSELKALCAHPAFRGEIDRDALVSYVRHGYVPAPRSIYRGVAKLPQGCVAEFTRASIEPRIEPYWSARAAALAGLADPLRASEDALVEELDALLRQAVRGQMEADVPLGAFLSGGIDSSTVVALMQAQSNRPINTFTIGFHEAEYNEAEHAKAIAAHLGTHHTELYVTPDEARAVIPRLPQIYCEPFADSSQIPTYLVSQLARRHVTVALSGDAGDELFGGYNRYLIAARLWRRLSAVPGALRGLAAGALRALPAAAWDFALKPVRTVLPHPLRVQHPGEKMHKLASVLQKASLDDVYLRLVSLWPDPAALVPGAREPRTPLTDGGASVQGLDAPLARMSFLDLVTYLPDDILVKVDRAAMAVSLETRVPLLDHRVVEYAWRIPLDYKVRAGRGKHLLRAVLQRYVPRRLFERPKMGFGVPIDHWLRGPLREWADHLLDPARLRAQGYFAVEPITRAWTEHRDGRASHQYPLWTILMFQAWLEHADGR